MPGTTNAFVRFRFACAHTHEHTTAAVVHAVGEISLSRSSSLSLSLSLSLCHTHTHTYAHTMAGGTLSGGGSPSSGLESDGSVQAGVAGGRAESSAAGVVEQQVLTGCKKNRIEMRRRFILGLDASDGDRYVCGCVSECMSE